MPENMLIEAHYQGDRGINAVNKVKYSPLEGSVNNFVLSAFPDQ